MELTSLLFLLLVVPISCWDSDDLELFDVVEEVGVNFYELLKVEETASASDIRKAFRQLSLQLHPDKNDAPDAEIKFRQLVAVHEILKDSNKRAKYHQVLENGLPDWRQAVYYYRRVRKMGLLEMSIILFIIVTIGQYLYGWASYAEQKFTLNQLISMKTKKLQKKQKKGKLDIPLDDLTELAYMSLKKPSIYRTLPFQIFQFAYYLIVYFPGDVYRGVKWYFEHRKRMKEEEAQSEESEEEPEIIRERGPRRRKDRFVVPEINSNDEQTETAKPVKVPKPTAPLTPPPLSGGLWTDDDLANLVKLMKKYPPGTQERWEKIAAVMQRTPAEVAHMAHKGFKPAKQEEEPEVEQEPKKVKTKGGKLGELVDEGVWSQAQQKAFESALTKYPKSNDRWEKISKCVPGKTKEECILRYKTLVEQVKKKKEKETVEQDSSQETEAAS